MNPSTQSRLNRFTTSGSFLILRLSLLTNSPLHLQQSTDLFFISIDYFVFSIVLYKYNHIECVLFAFFHSGKTLRLICVVVSLVCSFLFLNGVRFYRETTICLSINLLMDRWIISSCWIVQIKLLCPVMHKSLYGHMLSYLLVKYLAVEWLGHMARFMLTFVRNYHMVFQNDFTVLHSHQNCMEVLIFPHLCQPVGNPSFIFILAISVWGHIFIPSTVVFQEQIFSIKSNFLFQFTMDHALLSYLRNHKDFFPYILF